MYRQTGDWRLTDLLVIVVLVPHTVLVDLEVSGELLVVGSRSDHDVVEDQRALLPDGPEFLLLDNVGELLLILLALGHHRPHLGDLVVHLRKVVVVGRPERGGSNEGRVGVFERRVLLLSRDLAGRVEVDSEVRVLALFRLGRVLDRVNVERSGKAVDGEDDRLSRIVDVDL